MKLSFAVWRRIKGVFWQQFVGPFGALGTTKFGTAVNRPVYTNINLVVWDFAILEISILLC